MALALASMLLACLAAAPAASASTQAPSFARADYPSSGAGSWRRTSTATGGWTWRAAPRRRDGIKDLAIAGDSSRLYRLYGVGDGTFVPQPTITLTLDTFGVDGTRTAQVACSPAYYLT